MNHGKIIDMTGQRYTRLTVTSFHSSSRRGAQWTCLCDCGTWCVLLRDALVSGHNKSCGCLKKELMSKVKSVRPAKRKVKPEPIAQALPAVPPQIDAPCRWFSTLPLAGCVSRI